MTPMSISPALAEKTRRTTALLVEAAQIGEVALASSLSAEDMVLTDLIARHALPISIFAIDTGRLHEETVALIGRAQEKLGVAIEVYRPDPAAVARYVADHGANAF
jgi:phosphoadenosine phosphosulfate reductase